MDNLFAHAIGRIDLVGGLVRIELGTLAPSDAAQATPKLATDRALFIPVDGFLSAADMFEGFRRRLVDAGLVVRAPARPEAEAVKPVAALPGRGNEPPPDNRPKSPNFF